jgi:hypothetical protein
MGSTREWSSRKCDECAIPVVLRVKDLEKYENKVFLCIKCKDEDAQT